jgi:hypothetical protein
MRAVAMVLASAYVIGASLLLPGSRDRHIDHQISVRLAGAPAAPISGSGKMP